RIGGEVQRTDLLVQNERTFSLIPLLTLLFAALLLRFLLGKRIDDQVRHTMRSYGSYGLIGFGVFFLIPVCAALLFVSAIGSVVGLVVLVSYILLVVLSVALAPIYVGAQIGMLAKKGDPFSMWWVGAGAVALFAVLHIPFVGVLLF